MRTDSQAQSKKIDWFASLSRPQRDRLIFRQVRPRQRTLAMVLLDTSASNLGGSALAEAQAVTQQISLQCYMLRHHLCLISFGNQRIHTLLFAQRAPKSIEHLLDKIVAGGGTPLRKAIQQAGELITRYRASYDRIQLWLFTDGRTRDTLQGMSLDCEVNVIDTEKGAVKLNRCRQLAEQLNAGYMRLEEFSVS